MFDSIKQIICFLGLCTEGISENGVDPADKVTATDACADGHCQSVPSLYIEPYVAEALQNVTRSVSTQRNIHFWEEHATHDIVPSCALLKNFPPEHQEEVTELIETLELYLSDTHGMHESRIDLISALAKVTAAGPIERRKEIISSVNKIFNGSSMSDTNKNNLGLWLTKAIGRANNLEEAALYISTLKQFLFRIYAHKYALFGTERSNFEDACTYLIERVLASSSVVFSCKKILSMDISIDNDLIKQLHNAELIAREIDPELASDPAIIVGIAHGISKLGESNTRELVHKCGIIYFDRYPKKYLEETLKNLKTKSIDSSKPLMVVTTAYADHNAAMQWNITSSDYDHLSRYYRIVFTEAGTDRQLISTMKAMTARTGPAAVWYLSAHSNQNGMQLGSDAKKDENMLDVSDVETWKDFRGTLISKNALIVLKGCNLGNEESGNNHSFARSLSAIIPESRVWSYGNFLNTSVKFITDSNGAISAIAMKRGDGKATAEYALYRNGGKMVL